MRKQFNKIKIFASCLMILCVLGVTSIGSYAAVSTGTSKTVTVTYSDYKDSVSTGNTYLPFDFEYDYESENDYEYDVNFQSYDYWYKGKNCKLFDSEAQYYGYAVTVTRKTVSTCVFEDAKANFWCVGTADDLMNGKNRGGIVKSTSFTAWVPTNNSIQAVHMAPFFRFDDSRVAVSGEFDDTEYFGTYEIDATYSVKYTGYKTAADYANAMSSILSELQNQTGELGDINQGISDLDTTVDEGLGEVDDSINDGFDNAVNGFDTADGDAMNNQLDNTLKDYGTAEDSLFVSAKNGLDSFEFAEIKDYPSLVTAMSLVSSLMSSALIALGGTDSAASLVLAILFTIMLVSMAIGLYHFYQSKKGG